MITIFTCPKAFTGESRLIQRNAIGTWKRVSGVGEIILFGDDLGVPEAGEEFGLRCVPDILRSEYGTPLVNDIFEKAQKLAQFDLLCYINADILLAADLLPKENPFSRFLMVGRRWDLDVDWEIDFERPAWREELKEEAMLGGRLHSSDGIDYFFFSRGLYEEIPPFALGRTTWDNWLIYNARLRKIPVIDATADVTVIHQNHGYRKGLTTPKGHWKGPEAERNLLLGGGVEYCFSIRDADWRVENGRVKKSPLTGMRIFREIRAFPVLKKDSLAFGWLAKFLLQVMIYFRRMGRPIVGWIRERAKGINDNAV
ncbi:MAG TPA: hypothetical protein PKL97_10060 [Candidatus Omnitrophota bacterium]|nr:hypothetical protein [Candidatus Omnitrophota bacterium]